MAIYEFYCPSCRTRFEERRPMSRASETATCAKGHPSEKLLSSFAVATATAVADSADPDMSTGGCCGGGGGCACSAN